MAKTKNKRFIAMLLAVMMVFTTMPITSLTANAVTTNADGYIEVSTVLDLYNVRNDLTANYILINDIDLTEATAENGDYDFEGNGWNPIGSGNVYGNNAFTGVFDGNGYTISGIQMSADSCPSGTGDTVYLGLFANNTGTIKNLNVVGAISSSITNKKTYAAGLVAVNNGSVLDCSSNVEIKIDGKMISNVGGIAGQNGGIIERSYNVGDIENYVNEANSYTGGISGHGVNGTIKNCYNVGSVYARDRYPYASYSTKHYCYCGGIEGYSESNSNIESSYNIGAVTAVPGATGSEAYNSAISMLKNSQVQNCYYISGIGLGCTGATSLSDNQMKTASVYVGFDYNETWVLNSNAMYPYPQLRNNVQDDRDIASCEISSLPKTEYIKWEQFDISGCTLKYTFTNAPDEIINVTEDMVSGYDTNTIGTQTVTIKYALQTFTFDITVLEKEFTPIYTVADLYNVRNDLTANYILMNDIDLSVATADGGDYDFNGNGWNPIGSNDIYDDLEFSGIFNGNGYTISGMRIALSALPSGSNAYGIYLGLFANVSGTVKNLKIADSSITETVDACNMYVGSIAANNAGVIENCSSEAIIAISSYNNTNFKTYAGGIAGYNTGKILSSYNLGDVRNSGTYQGWSGGISGYGASNSLIENCYNKANVSGSEIANGILGDSSTSAIVRYCYNVGECSNYAISKNKVTSCYYLTGTAKGCTGAVALTEEQIKKPLVYSGFDFDGTWMVNANAMYPYPQLINNVQDDRDIVETVIYSLPKTTYTKWEDFDITGCTLKYSFTNAPTEFINVTEDMVSGYDMSLIGTQTLTIKYGYKTFTFEITISEKPFNEIYTIADLYNIRNDLTANYILMNDLDLTEATAEGGAFDFNGNGWNPIGSNDVYASEAFMGVFDGDGHTIKGMKIDASSLPVEDLYGDRKLYLGLFANVTGTVKNLNIVDSYISESDEYTYSVYAGGVAGINSGTIMNCSSDTGITVNGYYSKGGYGAITVRRTTYAGGITGYNTGKIYKCYNIGDITAGKEGYAGGISGYGSSAVVENCYNTAKISGANSAVGIQNGSTIRTSYNLGQCDDYGISSSSVTNCYYLMGTGSSCTGATPLSEEQFKDQAFLVGFDFDGIWISDPFAEYPYPQLRSNPQNLEKKVEEMIWVTEPEDKEYYIGEKINLTGAKVEVVYVSGLFEEIDVTETMVSGFDSSTVGTKTVTVSMGGSSLTFDITVKEYPTVTNLVLVSGPNKTEFVKGRPIDYTGAVVRATYEGGATADIDVTAAIVTGIDNSVYGSQTATVTVGGQTVTFEIKIIAYRLVGITVEKAPYKTTYIKDDVFNGAGLKVVADYNDGSTTVLQPYQYELTGYSNKVGVQTITVTYYGFSDTFEIEVVEKQLANIEITELPDVLDYIQGQELDMTGAVITATYNNGTTEVITDYNISGFTGEIGINNVVIASGGVSATFVVTIREKIVIKIDITSLPTKYGYNAGETLDTTGLVVKAFYNDDSEQEITDYSLVGFSTIPGTHVITVSYAGFTDSFEIFMNEKFLSDFQITTMPAKLTYYLGENLDLSDMVATAYYNNGENYAVTDYEVSGFDSQTPGTKVVTIAYGDISRDFAVTVKERVAVVTGGEIKVGSSVARLGDNIIVPISITKNTGLAGFTHTITFDHTRLEYKGVSLGEYYAKGTLIVNTEKLSEGEITVLWFNTQDIAANNVMYNIEFDVLETAADGNAQINIAFDENDNGNLEGNNVLFNAVGGNVEVRSYWLGDLNGDREYHMVDLLQLAQYVSGKEMTLTEKQKLSADVNEDTVIDIHDVIMLQQWIIAAGVPEA